MFAVPAFSEPRGEPIRYDISFIGTAHSSRWKVVRAIDASLPARVRRFWYLFLQARWVFWARRAATPALRGARADDFRYVPLSRDESAAVFWASRAILDVEHPGQTGLTIRTFEALAAGKKLVTTNPAIRDYALYDPARVCVIDRAAPVVPEGFLTTDVPPLDTVSARRYSLAGFIDEIFAEGDRSDLHLAAPSSTAARRAAA